MAILHGHYKGYVPSILVGEGAFTKIYKATATHPHPPYGRIAALKILQAQNEEERGKIIEQFKREASIAMSLSHPHIVGVYSYGKMGEAPVMLMEYVDGRNLKKFLYEPEKYSLSMLLRLCCKAAAGFAFVTENHIVHKDIKPDNILLSTDLATVKITDFGIAKLPDRWWRKDIFPKSGTVTRFGAISYIAPEQASGHAEFRSDVYSFGITVDEVLTAKMDIPDRNNEDYFLRVDMRAKRKNRGLEPIIAADLPIPHILKNAIEKATDAAPERRFQTMREFLDVLESFL